jgi:hypothetical protein
VTGQACGVPERKPSSLIAGSHLHRAFRMHIGNCGIVVTKSVVGGTLLALNGNAFTEGTNPILLLLWRLRCSDGTLTCLFPRCLRLLLRLTLLTADFKRLRRHGSDEGENQKESSSEHGSGRENVVYVTALHHLCLFAKRLLGYQMGPVGSCR